MVLLTRTGEDLPKEERGGVMRIQKNHIRPLDFHDLTVLDYTADLDTNFSLAIIVVPAGCSHPRSRSRRSHKYYYAKSGTTNFTVDGEEYVLNQGDFLVIERNKWFSYRNKSSSSAELVLVHDPRFVLEQEEFDSTE